MADLSTDMILRVSMWVTALLFTVAAVFAEALDRTFSAVVFGALALVFMRVAAEIAEAQAR